MFSSFHHSNIKYTWLPHLFGYDWPGEKLIDCILCRRVGVLWKEVDPQGNFLLLFGLLRVILLTFSRSGGIARESEEQWGRSIQVVRECGSISKILLSCCDLSSKRCPFLLERSVRRITRCRWLQKCIHQWVPLEFFVRIKVQMC